MMYEDDPSSNPFNNEDNYRFINETSKELMELSGMTEDHVAYVIFNEELYTLISKYVGGHFHAR